MYPESLFLKWLENILLKMFLPLFQLLLLYPDGDYHLLEHILYVLLLTHLEGAIPHLVSADLPGDQFTHNMVCLLLKR
jgi:hypothetical protein